MTTPSKWYRRIVVIPLGCALLVVYLPFLIAAIAIMTKYDLEDLEP